MNKIFAPKLFSMLKEGISFSQVKKDILSGLIVGVIALPLGIAFAIAGGDSPSRGIITAIIAGFIVAFLGGSRVQIGGPTGAFILMIITIKQQYGPDGLLIATLLAGVILIVMGLSGLGNALKFIPQTLIIGFTAAIAVIIFTSQIRDFLGLTINDVPDNFFEKWLCYFKNIGAANIFSVMITLITMGIIIGLTKINAKIPASIIAIIVTSLLVFFLKIPVETIFSRFGEIDTTIPIPHLPSLSLAKVKSLIIPAFSIAVLGSLESLLSAVVADGMLGSKHRSNTELIAQGIANVVSPLFGGLPATGAIARTATNINNGGRTPIAGMVHAITLLLIYLIAMPVVKYIPMATLAGILIVVAWKMSEFKEFINIIKTNIYEAAVLLVTFVLTLVMDLTVSIPIGFILSLFLFMKRMSDSVELTPLLFSKNIEDRLISEEVSGLPENIIIYELNGPMFFGSVHHLLALKQNIHSKHSTLILRFRYVPIIDTSGLGKLKTIIREMERNHIRVIFSGVNNILRKKFIKSEVIEKENMFDNFIDAIKFAQRPDKS